MRRKFNFSIGEYYHVYNRGVDKRIIFNDSHDYNRFIVLLHLSNSSQPVDIDKTLRGGLSFPELIRMDMGERLVDIGAYCLMPNHFHLLLKERIENGISIFLKKLSTAYSMYFNRKHERTGSLFQGPFQATHADNDQYLKYLFAYIHLNPIKIVDPNWKESMVFDQVYIKKHLENYKYSSYLDYLGAQRQESIILNKSVFPEYFNMNHSFEDFIEDWLQIKSELLLQ